MSFNKAWVFGSRLAFRSSTYLRTVLLWRSWIIYGVTARRGYGGCGADTRGCGLPVVPIRRPPTTNWQIPSHAHGQPDPRTTKPMAASLPRLGPPSPPPIHPGHRTLLPTGSVVLFDPQRTRVKREERDHGTLEHSGWWSLKGKKGRQGYQGGVMGGCQRRSRRVWIRR